MTGDGGPLVRVQAVASGQPSESAHRSVHDSSELGARDPRTLELGDEYPFNSHFVEVPGGWMHYLDEGQGPPIIMVHGNPTWSFYFRNLVKGLRDRHRVIVPDHIGCGLSDKPRQYPYTLATHIDNLERLIDELGLGDVSLLLHDWGGPIGFGWATRHPERVRRLAVLNSSVFLGGRMPWRIRVCRWPLFGEVALLGFNAFARAALRMACVQKDRMTPVVRRGYLLPTGRPADRVATLCFVRDIPMGPSSPSYAVLKQIGERLVPFHKIPMTLLWGMQDWCFTDATLAQWVEEFPQAEVHRIWTAGHYVVEDAHERISPILEAFFDAEA